MNFLRVVLAALVIAATTGGAAVAADEPPSITFVDWLRAPEVSAMELSPDGEWIVGTSGKGVSTVFLTRVDDLKTSVVARWRRDGRLLYGRWPLSAHWISNDLIAIDFSDGTSESVDRSGKRVASLGERFIRRMKEHGESTESVLAYRDVDDGAIDVVDARTGRRRPLDVDLPGKLSSWAFDAAGVLRAVTMVESSIWREKTRITQWYRAGASDPWQKLEESDLTGETWTPLRALPEPNALAVLSRHGRDTWAVVRYDTAARRFTEVLAEHPSEDIAGVDGIDASTFDSVVTHGMKPKVHWFDARWAALQAAVDVALPGRINRLQGDPKRRVLVTSYGDVDRGRWYVLDTGDMKLREVAAAASWLKAERQRPMETIEYAARDGMRVPAYLTRPASTPDVRLPLVVLIHGGPQTRDIWGWDEEVQMLAAHGYAVLQPQFRGSLGFGRRFQEAGYRQWGKAMQDDITDGVRHLVESGMVDPQRVCIYGASYGGYAALWGTIKTPELYKCAVSFAGVTDLATMLSFSLFNDSTAASREWNRARVGDPDRDRAELDEVSPLKQASRVGVPVLIAHGLDDVRVPASHSEKMVSALRALGKPVQWLPLPNEGHGVFFGGNRMNYYATVLEFLHRHLGGAAPQRSAPKPVPSRAPAAVPAASAGASGVSG